ncbi:MAG: DUF364 domain-containing protein [Pseudomonadota bacterium]
MNEHNIPPCRYVAVDLSNGKAEAEFDRAVNCLRSLGWTIGDGCQSIELVPAEQFECEGKSGVHIVRCASSASVKKFGAIKPDAFEIVSRLGGADLETALAESVSAHPIVDKVLVVLNWTLIRAGDLRGIARSPSRGTEGERTIRPESGFVGKSLKEVAAYLCSLDPLPRSLGLAAVNAFWNRLDPTEDVKQLIQTNGGLGGIEAPGDGVVIVGGFRAAQKRLPKARIVEREPKPGYIAVEDAAQAYKQAKVLAITAQTLMNGTLEPILRASTIVSRRMFVGLSTPLCQHILAHGVDEAFGAVIIDPDATEKFINETGSMIILDHIARSRCLRHSQEKRETA